VFESLIGVFANTVVLRIRVRDAQTIRAFLADVRRTTLEGCGHQDVPFEYIVERIALARRLDRTPIFQVTFTMPTVPGASIAGDPARESLAALRAPPSDRRVRFDLEVAAWEHADRIGLSWTYNRDLFDDEWIHQFARHHVRVIERPAVSPVT
jgi:non-ribosomal peptide synthetase component F